MITTRLLAAATLLFGFAGPLSAQVPAGATGKCKDGTYSTSANKKQACVRHGGIAEWYAGVPVTGVRPVAPPAPPPAPLPVSPLPPGAPAGATALCGDGTYYMGQTRTGACAGHRGVKAWYKQVP